MIETTGTQQPALPDSGRAPAPGAPEGAEVASAVRAALAVPGVRAVRVEADGRGAALLRLELEDDADEDDVARAVDARVRAARAAAIPAPAPAADAAPVAQPAPLVAPAAEDADGAVEGPTDGAVDGAVDGRGAVPGPSRPARSGRVPVPAVSSPTVAATPAPRWLGEAPQTGPAALAEPLERTVERAFEPAAERAAERLLLQRVEVVTEGLTTTSTVVLRQGGGLHTGVADAAATPTGAHRALATAAVRALESAAGGRLRMEVDAVTLAEQLGETAALVALSVLSGRGSERLVGAALAGADPHRAVVKAVLSACNRRFGFDLGDAPGARP
ncbi:hypothetical protein [Quadrisphaera sp. DSM 44207]|uniref:hypothetical protein n=1 Tax=Quadrisphaera sp. DSM 44207 TaxID=1881057 RepID=UPI00088D9F59|nr:hypothetical protein [Quadrisphaera sp. DSM 44207]SDQ72084.1 hypothetical protein SAMN05428996_2537 [Quadrisphaera sp. DSM 44207]